MTVYALPTRSIADQLEQLAALNDDPEAGGITREVFTPTYSLANDFVADLMRAAGLDVRVDAFGNLRGRMEGPRPVPRPPSSPARTSTRRLTPGPTTACSGCSGRSKRFVRWAKRVAACAQRGGDLLRR